MTDTTLTSSCAFTRIAPPPPSRHPLKSTSVLFFGFKTGLRDLAGVRLKDNPFSARLDPGIALWSPFG
jgi:hypothetical protein